MRRGLRVLAGCAIAWLLFASPTLADDLRVQQLESEVNRLQRELTTLAARVEQLERINRGRGSEGSQPTLRSPGSDSPAWLVAANWNRLQPGMSVADVISLLGRPTSTRTSDSGAVRMLMYALELGPQTVLAGNVMLGEKGVTEVHRPQILPPLQTPILKQHSPD